MRVNQDVYDSEEVILQGLICLLFVRNIKTKLEIPVIIKNSKIIGLYPPVTAKIEAIKIGAAALAMVAGICNAP